MAKVKSRKKKKQKKNGGFGNSKNIPKESWDYEGNVKGKGKSVVVRPEPVGVGSGVKI